MEEGATDHEYGMLPDQHPSSEWRSRGTTDAEEQEAKIHQKSHFKNDFQRSVDPDAGVIYEWQRYETISKDFKEHVFSHRMFFRPFPAELLATFLLLQRK